MKSAKNYSFLPNSYAAIAAVTDSVGGRSRSHGRKLVGSITKSSPSTLMLLPASSVNLSEPDPVHGQRGEPAQARKLAKRLYPPAEQFLKLLRLGRSERHPGLLFGLSEIGMSGGGANPTEIGPGKFKSCV